MGDILKPFFFLPDKNILNLLVLIWSVQVILSCLSFSGVHVITDLCSFCPLLGTLLCYFINLHNSIPNQKYINTLVKEALICPEECSVSSAFIKYICVHLSNHNPFPFN